MEFEVSIAQGSTRDIEAPCKPGRYYVYVHKGLDSTVFYVGKGTGSRAHSKDRQPEWHYYVKNILNSQYEVEIVRDGVSEEDAEDLEQGLLARHAERVINLQTFHAPYDKEKFLKYTDTIRAYSDSF